MQYSITFYTLLYVEEGNEDSKKIDMYLKCAMHLHDSLMYNDQNLKIISNNPDLLNEKLRYFSRPEIAIEIPFLFKVPKDINYYSAHFKLDVIREFAKGNLGERVALVDSDAVMLRPFPSNLEWSSKSIFTYDLTEMVAGEFGDKHVSKDVELLTGSHIENARWFGGEFIAGTPAAFAILSKRIDQVWKTYSQLYKSTNHQGDEMVVTAALDTLSQEKLIDIIDIGDNGKQWIGRWFSGRATFIQKNLRYYLQFAMIHLPSDKQFLADISNEGFSPSSFLNKYISNSRKKVLKRRIYTLLRRPFETKKYYVPKIS
jgi:hypothetical protein